MSKQTIQIDCPTCGEELQAEITSKHADTERLEFSTGHGYVVKVGVLATAFVMHQCEDL